MLYLPEGQQKREFSYTPAQLRTAMAGKTILWARAVLFDAARQLHFQLGCCEGIMPFEECALGADAGSVREIAVIGRVGRMTCFVVTELEARGSGFVAHLSRAQAQQICREQYFDRLSPGDVIPARVTSIESFGAFCDVGCGLIALLPIDYLSVSRIRSPGDRLHVGQDIFCVVKKRDDQGRLVLSMKELLGTWDENAACFQSGETVIGRIRGMESYGVFVELSPNLAGLAETVPELALGDCVSVYIKSILPGKMKIKLVVLSRIDAVLSPPPLRFFLTQGHLENWNYASAACARQIESIFG